MKATITMSDGATKEVSGYLGHHVNEGSLEVFTDRLPEDIPALSVPPFEWRSVEVTA